MINSALQQSTLKGYSSNATTPIMAVVSKTEKDTEKPYICGQLNSVGYDLNRLRLYLVPVNGATIDAAGVKTTLNNIYKQAAIEWDVEYSPKELSLTLTPEELAAVCANIDAGALSNYSPGMLAALKKLDREPDANNYELFIINGTANGVKGFMPLNRSAGLIFTGNQSAAEVQQTIAHELGHGAFGLEHVGTAAGKTATDNLMDYTASTALDKPQWDLIHGEHRRLTWFQGEEEGMWTTDGHYYTLQLVAKMMGLDDATALRYGKASEEPDTHITVGTMVDEIRKDTIIGIGAHERTTFVMPNLQQKLHALTGGFHGVELAITAYAFTKSHKDDASFNYLIHRFGDCFAHFDTDFDTYELSSSVLLKDYISAIDKYVNKTFEFSSDNSKYLLADDNLALFAPLPNGKIATAFTPDIVAQQLVDYLLSAKQNLTIVSIPLLPQSKFATKTLTEHWEGIYLELPPAAQNKFIMYGDNVQVGCFTNGHTIDGGPESDNITKRSKLYLFYIKQLIQLVEIREGLSHDVDATNKIITEFTNLLYYISNSNVQKDNINRLDAILAFRIELLKKPNANK